MIDFFTDPYKDELIYSAIARYHFYSGNADFKDTIEECFGKRSMVSTFELGGRLDYLAKELGGRYTAEKIVNENTIFPYYTPFIDKEKRNEVLDYMKFKGSSSIYTELGIVAGSICKSDSIYYCPVCAKEEVKLYGEAYIHREHQLQGIMLCPHHGCRLKEYPINKLDSSRIEYIKFEKELLCFKPDDIEINNYEKRLRLAKDAYYLLSHNLEKFNKESITKRYKFLLYTKDFARATGTIKQRKLYESFINFYGEEFLKELNCSIDFNNEYNWLKVVTRNTKRATHPLRHLLIIGFLCDDIEEFFSIRIRKLETTKMDYNIENCDSSKLVEYKNNVLTAIKENKNIKRTELREKFKKEYTYLYRYDKQWLFGNLPKKVKADVCNKRVNWEKRDNEYLDMLIKKYNEIKAMEKPVRITNSSLAKPLGILVNIQKKISKLPKTKGFLEKVCESTEEFQLRRCKYVIDQLIEDEKELKLWQVQRIAAIRTNEFNKLKEKLIKYINEKELRGYNGENAT